MAAPKMVPGMLRPATMLRSPDNTPPLIHLLQMLSNLCFKIRLNFSCSRALVLADSVRHHLITPLRLHILKCTPAVQNVAPTALPYEYQHTTLVILQLLTSFLPDPPERPGFQQLSSLYDHLYSSMHSYAPTSHTFITLKNIWADMISILGRQLDLWLSQQLHPELLEQFFIDISITPPVVDQKRLPAFIPPAVAEMVLFAGTATRCNQVLARVDPNRPNLDGPIGPLQLDARDTIARLRENPIAAPLTIQSATSRWRNTAASHLSTLLPFSDIAMRLHQLRDFLLHGNPLFWHLFFEELRTKRLHLPTPQDGALLTAEELGDAERALNHILATVSSDMHHNVDATFPADPPFSLHLSSTASLMPRFALSFHETPVLASRVPVYCDLFSLTFAVRRAVTEVRAAFAHLLRLRRGVRPRSAVATGLAPLFEVRRRMLVFLDGLEWYVQADVLDTKFRALHTRLRERTGSGAPELFDEFCTMHERALDAMVGQCFLNDSRVQTRLYAIFAACVAFADFVQEVERVDGEVIGAVAATASAVKEEFERNVDLFVQMVLHSQKGVAESKVHSLLLRLNFNKYEVF